MKNLFVFLTVTCCILLFSCKEKDSDRFKFLTEPVWVAETLIANGIDATGPGGLLEGFVGDAKFNADGTGTFGTYTGTWTFNATEDKLIITTPSLPISITLNIVELTSTTLKLQGSLPDPQNPFGPVIDIQMTFIPK
ncbi:MAG: hypothetical protein E4H43_00090 [Bacteroidia bacterium]|nr:MAG: hypothetical protein E4H43_00090 [Bacteroidia bacterium]